MSYDLFSILYVSLFLVSLVVLIMLAVVLFRANRILKNTEKISDTVTDGLSKLISAALSVATVTGGIAKIVKIMEEKFARKKKWNAN